MAAFAWAAVLVLLILAEIRGEEKADAVGQGSINPGIARRRKKVSLTLAAWSHARIWRRPATCRWKRSCDSLLAERTPKPPGPASTKPLCARSCACSLGIPVRTTAGCGAGVATGAAAGGGKKVGGWRGDRLDFRRRLGRWRLPDDRRSRLGWTSRLCLCREGVEKETNQ